MRTRAFLALSAAVPSALGLLVVGCVTEEVTPPATRLDGGNPDSSVPAPDGGRASLDDLASATIDFGLQDCGATPAPKAFTFRNTGSASLTYTLKLEKGTAFALQGETAASLAAGATATITLAPTAIPTTASAATVLADKLLVTTSLPGFEKIAVPVTLTTQGGTLVVAPATAGFGQVQLTSQATDIPVDVKNVGNKAVDVALATPTNTDFAVTWAGTPAAATVAPGASLAGALARFRPTALGVKSDTIAVTATGALCQPAPPALALAGEGVTAVVTVAPGPIDFSTTNCGATAAARTVTVTNGYGFPIRFTATLGKGTGSPYTLPTASQSGSVPANGTATLTVNAKAVPAVPGSLASGALDDMLVVASPDAPGFASASVSLVQKARGGVLILTPATAAFGQVQVTAQAPNVAVDSKNTGNAPVTVAVAAPSSAEFGATWTGTPAAVSIAANASLPNFAARFRPASAGNKTATSALTVTNSVLCQAAPPTVSYSGIGVTAPVTVAPGAVDFAATPCGTTAAARSVTITNGYGFPVSFSASLTKGAASPYTLPVATGSVPANGSTVVAINAKVVPRAASSLVAGALDDTLTVSSSNAPGFTTASVALRQQGSGAVLAVAMGDTSFGNVALEGLVTLPFQVTNSGNLDAPLTVSATTTTGGSVFGASLSGAGNIVSGSNGTRSGTATFSPPERGPHSGTLSVTTTANLCQAAAPAGIALTGTGIGPVVTFPTSAPRPVTATCGVAPTATINYTVTNTGDGPLTLTAAVTGPFVLDAASQGTLGPVNNGGTITVVVRPTAPVIGTDRGGTSRSGTLVLTSNENGSTTHAPVPLSVGYNGANLEPVDGSDNVITGVTLTSAQGCPAGEVFAIRNSGNQAASIARSNSPQHFSISGALTTTPVSVDPGTTFVRAVIVRPYSFSTQTPVCNGSSGLTFATTPASGSGICIDMTAPLPLEWAQTNGATACYCS